MTTEVELKFFVSRDLQSDLMEWIAHQAILSASDCQLGNIYYDTDDRLLRSWRCGLRIRSQNGQREQTIKCGGQAVAGLHQRPEYTTAVNGEWPELAAFPASLWPAGTDLAQLQAALRPQFRTDFRRQAWRISPSAGTEIELAYDRGVIEANGRQAPLNELELEVVSGDPSTLFALARSLLSLGGLRLGSQSKAQRGYRLAGLTPEPEVRRMGFVPVTADMTVGSALLAVFGFALEQWQYHEQLLLETPSLAALTQVRNGVALLQQTQQFFADLLVELAPRTWQDELGWLEQSLGWLDEAQALERLASERGHYLRSLQGHDAVLAALQARQQALPSLADMQTLCLSSRYTALLLEISAWLWQVQQQVLSLGQQPLAVFACQVLEESWQELHAPEMQEPHLDEDSYLMLVGKLRRNLLAGVSFAALFDVDEQQGFRLPWLNLLRRMEELEHFAVLDALASTLPTSARLELGEWLTERIAPRLIELDQGRLQALDMVPYWRNGERLADSEPGAV